MKMERKKGGKTKIMKSLFVCVPLIFSLCTRLGPSSASR